MFGLSNSAVYQPVIDTTQWTALTPFAASVARSEGATAVVGNLIYCLGGTAPNAASAARVSNIVTIFNTTSQSWSMGVPLTSGRKNFAAAGYNGKVCVCVCVCVCGVCGHPVFLRASLRVHVSPLLPPPVVQDVCGLKYCVLCLL